VAKPDRLAKADLRERMTSSILELLAHLPETHKKMFVWKHYHGWQVEKIAERLRCSGTDVEGILRQINLRLLQEAGSLLA
jgi:DNA-directed RNA polymerase specialized sigma24 family protein